MARPKNGQSGDLAAEREHYKTLPPNRGFSEDEIRDRSEGMRKRAIDRGEPQSWANTIAKNYPKALRSLS
jgi:hypothetical protein